MTILVVLLGLLISHYATGLGRWRRFDWLMWPALELRRRIPGQAAVVVSALILTILLVSAAATALATLLLGVVGWALLALAVFVYTLGPRDLDRDVEWLLNDPQHVEAVEAARALGIRPDDLPTAAGAAVLRASGTRWFAILFWFTVLGIPGVLLYRTTDKALQLEQLDTVERDWLARLRFVLEWPVILLMAVAAGLVADLDRVVQAWKRWRSQRHGWFMDSSLIDAVAAALLSDAEDFAQGLRRGHHLAWRMLVLWLVVMSLMLLAGWLA